MSTNYCECCGEVRTVKPVVIDDNMECELCTPCIRDLRKVGSDVEMLTS